MARWGVWLMALSQIGLNVLHENVSGMDICIQNNTEPVGCSVVKGHMESNEVSGGKITSPLCLSRHLRLSEQVRCSKMETLHFRTDRMQSFRLLFQSKSFFISNTLFTILKH